MGRHVYQIGDKDCGLLELREINFNFPVREE
jgi:hypothetical protein